MLLPPQAVILFLVRVHQTVVEHPLQDMVQVAREEAGFAAVPPQYFNRRLGLLS
jgi:hypothetical protein